LDINWIVESVFKIDKKIRYVGIVDREFRLIQSRMRVGIKSITSDQTDRDFISIVPPVIVNGLEKLQPTCGKLSGLTVRYEGVVLSLYPIAQYVVVISFEPDTETPFLDKIGDSVRKIMSQVT